MGNGDETEAYIKKSRMETCLSTQVKIAPIEDSRKHVLGKKRWLMLGLQGLVGMRTDR